MKQKEGKTGSDLNLKKTRHSKIASPPTTIRVCISLRTYMTVVSNSPTPHRRFHSALPAPPQHIIYCWESDEMLCCRLLWMSVRKPSISVSLWELFEENYIIYLTAAKTLRGNFCQNKCRCACLDKPTVCVCIYLNSICAFSMVFKQG